MLKKVAVLFSISLIIFLSVGLVSAQSVEEEIRKNIEKLSSAHPLEVRWKAMNALVKIGPPAVPALLEVLKGGDEDFRSTAYWVLERMGLPAVPNLIKALKREDREVRSLAAYLLGNIREKEAVPPLISLLKDTDLGVRWEAVRALGKIGDSRAIPALLEILTAKNEGIRVAAVEALGRIARGEGRSNEKISLALAKALKDENRYVRYAAAGELAALGDKRAIPVLIEALRDENEEIRWRAAEMLGKIGDRKTIRALKRVAKRESDPGILAAITIAIEQIKSRRR